MSMMSAWLSELLTSELLVLFLTPLAIVIGVYFLFKSGSLGPDPEPEAPNHA